MYLFFKRILDIIVSALVLLILLPILIPIMIGLKLTGEGYIFYRQRRIGYKNQYFNILKYTTMLQDSLNMENGAFTIENDSRFTPMGKFLRKSKINEIPQFVNVLLGDMSLVGPRPLDDLTFRAYSIEIQNRIYDSKPGITGIGSIVFRDEEALISASQIPPYEYYVQHIAAYKGALEMWYMEHKSFRVDVIIIFLTAWIIILPKSTIITKVFTNLPKRIL